MEFVPGVATRTTLFVIDDALDDVPSNCFRGRIDCACSVGWWRLSNGRLNFAPLISSLVNGCRWNDG